jgi:hypothetical protein
MEENFIFQKPISSFSREEWIVDQKVVPLGNWVLNGIKSFFYRLERLFFTPQCRRLAGSLETFRHEVSTRRFLNGEKQSGVFENIIKLLDDADEMLQKNRLDEGWKYLHTARRTLIYTYSSEDLQAVAVAIRGESSKLSEWRKNTVEELMGSLKAPVKECTPEQVFQAALILDEHFHNQYYRMHLWRRQVEIMSLLLFVEMATVIWMMYSQIILLDGVGGIHDAVKGMLVEGAEGFPDAVKVLPGVLLFGLVGGTLSGLFPIDNAGKNTKIPELLANFMVMLLQVVIGAGSAFAAFFLIRAGFLKESLADLLQTPYVLYAISFIAGFDRRLVLKMVKGVVGEEK